MNFIREPIFSSSIRAFCTALFGFIGIVVGLFVLILVAVVPFSNQPQMPYSYRAVMAPDANGHIGNFSQSATILKINVKGIIGADITSDMFDQMIVQVQKMFSQDMLKGVIVVFTTPGGTATDSYNMYQSLNRLKKQYNGIPIYGFVDGLCASGGLYVSAACDKMFATPPSIIGSLGVRIGPFFNIYDFLNSHGVDALNITSKNKIRLDPFTKWKPDQVEEDKKLIQHLVDSQYNQFLNDVVNGISQRNHYNEEQKIACKTNLQGIGADIFDAEESVKYGYIDDPHASYYDTIQALATTASLEESKYQVVEMVYIPPLQSLLGANSLLTTGTIQHELKLPAVMNEKFNQHRIYYYYDGN